MKKLELAEGRLLQMDEENIINSEEVRHRRIHRSCARTGESTAPV